MATSEPPSPGEQPADGSVDPQSLFPVSGDRSAVQTEWTRTCADYELGFEEAAHLLVDLAAEGRLPAQDHVGLALVFLERHRLELMLKGGILDLSRRAPKGHRLLELWARFVELATSNGYIDEKEFDHSRALVEALDGLDPEGQVFRYPTDAKGARHAPPEFIDLGVLHAAVNHVWRDAAGALTYLDELAGASPDWGD